MGYCLFELSNALDISELGLRPDCIVVAASSQSTKNVSTLLLPTNFDQPSWRLGEEPDAGKKDKQKDNLESDGESPADGGFAVIDKGQSTVAY